MSLYMNVTTDFMKLADKQKVERTRSRHAKWLPLLCHFADEHGGKRSCLED